MITYDTLYRKYSKCNIEIVNKIDSYGNIKSYKYKDILERVELLADKYKKYINSNDRCLICTDDSVNFVVYYLLLFKLNSVAILIDKNASKREINKIVEEINPTIAIVDEKHYELFDNLTNIIINIELDELSINKEIRKVKKVNEDAKTIIFSSGTTSNKSGIIHKTSNIYEMIKYTNVRYKVNKREKFITIVPNSHIYGLALNTVFNTYIATRIYYLEVIDAKVIFKVLKDIDPNYLCGVTKFYELISSIIKNKLGKKAYLVKICFYIRKIFNINIGLVLFKKVFETFTDMCLITAGAPLDDETEKFLFGLGFPIIEFYGATETNVPIITTVDKYKYTYGVGQVMEPSKIKIKEDTNELLVKNDYMLHGYVLNNKKLEDVIDEDGYINTGDIAKITNKGIYITGRTKEVIVLSTGEKISPDDLEEYYEDLDVKDYAICGNPATVRSKCDKIHMFIVKKDNQSINEIIDKINEISKELEPSLKVKEIHFIKEIPRTSIGKPRRYLLKKMI